MVFFTCSHCGESLKKNKVEKHYQTVCRGNGVAVTCVDCCKDFNEETFTAHTKCVTEEERYAAKGFTPKPSANKGERKQQRWQDIIKNVKNTRKDLSQNEIQILALLTNQENVPRKRNKFQNYLKTNLSGRYKEEVANRIFDILEEQSKLEEAKDKEKTDENDKQEQNGEAEEKENMSVCENKEEEEEKQLSKKEKKELKKKAKYEAQLKQIENENEAVEENPEEEEEVSKKSKKSKKHKEITVMENGIEEGKGKKKNKSVENGHDATEEETKSKKKKRKKDAVVEDEEPAEKKSKDKEAEEAAVAETLPKQKFNWEEAIVSLLEAKDDKEISLKRLKKKVLAELESCGETNTEKNITKFNKKINKIPGIVILKDKVKLKA